ncbi:YheC/YheD family protein [Alteribacillus iranensis]|uniref:YheC/D like ATP-grasp n=1 Tax=Alteribacillus iranensis TaxID=930128 RepID=A0A1I2EYJ5_9BACI|nr:YheC/YheD family protein [Alteribacillus iranensis]SFE97518.1 YheC/D like ATP-grasp [Alteribacillus iranensis]
MIGIIVSSRTMRQKKSHSPPFLFTYYKKLAQQNKVDVCFYALKHLSLRNKTVKGVVYSYSNDRFRQDTVRVPEVNVYKINSYLRNKENIHKVKYLSKYHGRMFFHAITNTERSKLKIHHYLQNHKEIAPMLPETKKLTYETVQSMLKKYSVLYIKPRRSSRGNDIYVLKKQDTEISLYRVKNFQEETIYVPKEQLSSLYFSTFRTPEEFLIQQGIDAKRYKGKKFDFRISPQKNKDSQWQITGMTARLSKKFVNITNLDQGGQVFYKTKKLIHKSERKIIKKAAILIAKTIEAKYPQVIDLGLDMAIDKKGQIWLYEVNFRPYRRRMNIKHNRIPFEHAVSYWREKFE